MPNEEIARFQMQYKIIYKTLQLFKGNILGVDLKIIKISIGLQPSCDFKFLFSKKSKMV